MTKKYGNSKVIATDIREDDGTLSTDGPFEILDAMDYKAIEDLNESELQWKFMLLVENIARKFY